MIPTLRNKAKELLKNKQVEAVIGFQEIAGGQAVAPCLVTTESEADRLTWNAFCVNNLAVYLKDFKGKKVGIIAKACDVRSIVVLLQENQLKREELFIIGVECSGMIDQKRAQRTGIKSEEIVFAEKCRGCVCAAPALTDFLVQEDQEKIKPSKIEDRDAYESIRKMEAKSLADRLKFWQQEFDRCIRCYACRQVCPMCYCPKCVVDQISPAWFTKAVGLTGNFSWNVTRAVHLAARCIDCGECERACPVNISLREINKKIEKDVKELFHYEAGLNPEQKPLFNDFDKNDPDDFIR